MKMFFKEPKNTKKTQHQSKARCWTGPASKRSFWYGASWTKHAKEKMKFYRLSERRLKRVLRNPKRIERGIVPGTIAIMQPAGTKKHPTEIWLMYQKIRKEKIRIITAWRYPGISPVREPPPVPDDILKFLWKLKL